MINKNCSTCNQLVQKSIQDRCMYCGAKLPLELCCSDEEKEKLLVIKKLYNENRIKQERKNKTKKLDTDLEWRFDNNGDWGL